MTIRLNNERVRKFFNIGYAEFNKRMLSGDLPIADIFGEKRHTFRIYKHYVEKYIGRELTPEEYEYLKCR